MATPSEEMSSWSDAPGRPEEASPFGAPTRPWGAHTRRADAGPDGSHRHAGLRHAPGEPRRERHRPAELQHADSLIGTIEGEVIPRLMLAAAASRRAEEPGIAAAATPSGWQDAGGEVEVLSELVLESGSEAVIDRVQVLLNRGVTLSCVQLEVLAAVADRLGELWEDDRRDFTEVTVGLSRLHYIVEELASRYPPALRTDGARGNALLVAVPGEHHSFGLRLLGDFLRRDGWEVWDEPLGTLSRILDQVSSESFGVVGLSVSCDTHTDMLATQIRAVRRASMNPRLGVMVGGRPFAHDAERALLMGADATAVDARQATQQAACLQRLLHSRR